jgi:hypothetical protein
LVSISANSLPSLVRKTCGPTSRNDWPSLGGRKIVSSPMAALLIVPLLTT